MAPLSTTDARRAVELPALCNNPDNIELQHRDRVASLNATNARLGQADSEHQRDRHALLVDPRGTLRHRGLQSDHTQAHHGPHGAQNPVSDHNDASRPRDTHHGLYAETLGPLWCALQPASRPVHPSSPNSAPYKTDGEAVLRGGAIGAVLTAVYTCTPKWVIVGAAAGSLLATWVQRAFGGSWEWFKIRGRVESESSQSSTRDS